MCEVQLFQVCLLTNEGHDNIQGLREYDVQKTIFISTPKYFHVCQLSLFMWKWGDGTLAEFERAFLTVMLAARAVLLLRRIQLL